MTSRESTALRIFAPYLVINLVLVISKAIDIEVMVLGIRERELPSKHRSVNQSLKITQSHVCYCGCRKTLAITTDAITVNDKT